jgi:hypothetical protein
LFEICNDLILAQSMPSGAVHPITQRRPSGLQMLSAASGQTETNHDGSLSRSGAFPT